MARAPLKFKQTDVARAVKGAKAGGFDVGRIEIASDGRIVMFDHGDASQPVAKSNAWDEVYAQKAAEVLSRVS